MPIPNPTAWRWPDSTFGPQKQVPFNDNQQYPDCGPSIRVYTLENILYGLEEVLTPLIQTLVNNIPATGNEISESATLTASATALGSAACRKVDIWLPTTATAPAEIILNSTGGGTSVFLEAGYSISIECTNLDRIEVLQSGGEADTIYFKYI